VSCRAFRRHPTRSLPAFTLPSSTCRLHCIRPHRIRSTPKDAGSSHEEAISIVRRFGLRRATSRLVLVDSSSIDISYLIDHITINDYVVSDCRPPFVQTIPTSSLFFLLSRMLHRGFRPPQGAIGHQFKGLTGAPVGFLRDSHISVLIHSPGNPDIPTASSSLTLYI
jgi:hypothetical protein